MMYNMRSFYTYRDFMWRIPLAEYRERENSLQNEFPLDISAVNDV